MHRGISLIGNKGFCLIAILFVLSGCEPDIDRHKLVTRHNISHAEISPLNALTIGNGEFAFTADITGLQSFPEYYEAGIPLGTMSQWAWHRFPNPEKYGLTDVVKQYWSGKDSIPYYFQFTNSPDIRRSEAVKWLRENPHRVHLGLIGLDMIKSDSTPVTINDIQNPVQKLNLWTGELHSRFEIEGIPVEVTTFCHQQIDMVSVKVESELIRTGRLAVSIRFPYARHEKFNPGYDLENECKHITLLTDSDKNFQLFRCVLDSMRYYTRLDWEGDCQVQLTGQHHIELFPVSGRTALTFDVVFSKSHRASKFPSFCETKRNNARSWSHFWKSGGAIDFSSCTDPRAFELERRIILSQYLTRIQCSGTLPPQETGLTYNSWYGKFHLEMHWWHAVHFILWNRPELIGEQLDYYFKIVEEAGKTARLQGYDGVRWPKMTGPEGSESPSTIGVFLIWQQPHIIYFSELLYQYHQQDTVIPHKYRNLVFATADFMASYARYDSTRKQYVLGPALIPAQERFTPEKTVNPSFELAYWHWALETAQQWRLRSGLPRKSEWQSVLDNLSSPPMEEGLYLFTETARDSYSNSNFMTDHPMVLAMMGFLPETDFVNREVMDNTLNTILSEWDWKSCWGWDFPMIAMNATVLHKPEIALDILMKETQKNTWLMNGHNYQDETLRLYLPGNGALLTAAAFMCTYRNDDGSNGFPNDGHWKVKYENLFPLYPQVKKSNEYSSDKK
jgi:hypothetical protein